MSIIAVQNIPLKVSLKDLVKELKKPIWGPFEALNFGKHTTPNQLKTCYIRLGEKLDPAHAVQNINNTHFKARGKYFAYIPDEVPDIDLGTSLKSKLKRCPKGMRRQLRIADKNSNGKIIKVVTDEILTELQAKYPGIYSMSKKCGHKLLKALSKTIYDRVKVLIESSPGLENSCFKSTRAYRRAHPHFGDFQLVLATAHAVDDELGAPRSALQESDITTAPAVPLIFDLSKEKVKSLCDKYTSKILVQMKGHLDELDSEILPTDNEDQIAKKQVRQELKKMQPYLHTMISQVLNKHFLPPEGKDYRMRIYGEPSLPSKETLMPFLARYRPRQVMRSMRMFNMLLLSVAPAAYSQLVAMNGTVLNGSKLLIGSSDVILFKASQSITDLQLEEAEGYVNEADRYEEGDDEPVDDEPETWGGTDMEL